LNIFLLRNLTEAEILLFKSGIGETYEAIFSAEGFLELTGFEWESAKVIQKTLNTELDRRGINDNLPVISPKVYDSHFRSMLENEELKLLCKCIGITLTELDHPSSFSSRVGVEKDIAIEIYECLLTELKQR
jgi:hypothetical protein